MLTGVGARLRSLFRHAESAGSPAADSWRFEPNDWAAVWSRAAVIHFPPVASRSLRRLPQEQPPGEPSSRMAAGIGPSGDFLGFRPYEAGDETRRIDWRATARARRPMVRKFEPESTAHVVIVTDVSASMRVPVVVDGRVVRPLDMAFETAVWIGAAALARQMPVDLILTSDRVELRIVGLRGRSSLRRIVRNLATFRPEHSHTDWSEAANEVARLRRTGFGFWLSDFTWLPEPTAFRRSLGQLSVVGVRIASSFEDSGIGASDHVRDAETGAFVSDPARSTPQAIAERAERWSRAARLPHLPMPIDERRPELVLAAWLKGATPMSPRRGAMP